MFDARPVRRIVAGLLVWALAPAGAPALASGAPATWSKVTSLRRDAHIKVLCLSPETTPTEPARPAMVVEGWFVAANAAELVMRTADAQPVVPGRTRFAPGLNTVSIARGRVLRVEVISEVRPWYAVPLVALAVVGGVAVAGLALIGLIESGAYLSDEGAAFLIAGLAAPVLFGAWAWHRTDSTARRAKVVYEVPPPVPGVARSSR